MGRIANRIEDKRLLKLIRAFLNAGVMENGLVSPSVEGLPKETSFAPLRRDKVNELDRELERRGTSFRSLRGRLQHLRSQRAGGSTGDGEHHAIYHAKAQAQGQ